MQVSVKRVDGSLILSLPVATIGSESVAVLRQRVAEMLTVHVSQVSLLHDCSELLCDHQQLSELFSGATSESLVAVTRPCPARPEEYSQYIMGRLSEEEEEDERHGGQIESYAACVSRSLEFPEPQGIDINMMPFVIGKRESLPKECQHYWSLIEACDIEDKENGKIGFLTIQESVTEPGESQRRPGLHVEAPRVVTMGSRVGGVMAERFHDWGFSEGKSKSGGLYMGSNVSRSTRIWNCRLHPPEKVVGILGDIEHLREALGEGTYMEAGELWWLTDTTPHESLPLDESTHRQYFRVVTSGVSAWYAKHSTANPLGVEPDPAVTTTILHNKFDSASLARIYEDVNKEKVEYAEAQRLQKMREGMIEEELSPEEAGLEDLFG